jgi:hypothetical protein
VDCRGGRGLANRALPVRAANLAAPGPSLLGCGPWADPRPMIEATASIAETTIDTRRWAQTWRSALVDNGAISNFLRPEGPATNQPSAAPSLLPATLSCVLANRGRLAIVVLKVGLKTSQVSMERHLLVPWASDEVAGAKFGDARLDARFAVLLSALVAPFLSRIKVPDTLLRRPDHRQSPVSSTSPAASRDRSR